jgi:hypothetical protein
MTLLSKPCLTLAALAALAAASVPAAQAQTTAISVFATGVDASGTPLPNGTFGDPHYTLVSEPSAASSQLQVLTSAFGFPVVPGGWLGDSSSSAWIAPTNVPFLNGGQAYGGFYDYQTTFTLAGFNSATEAASLSGQWAADDSGTLFLNGVSTGQATDGYGAYSPFSITSGFQSGVNTLDFMVLEDGSGATGLRVDGIGGTLSPAAVPEASSTVSLGVLLTLGLGGLLLARRKSVKA